MDSTSRPTYPTSVNFEASTFRKGAAAEAGQAPRDLGLPHPRGPDHQDVLGRDLRRDLRGKPLAADAVAERDRDRLLGRRLADDVAVELGHDLARGEPVQGGELFAGGGELDGHQAAHPGRRRT
jgi:hypothetical protein